MTRAAARGLVALWVLAAQAAGAEPPQRFEEVRRFDAAAARQGVAVDAGHFYAIADRSIEKYDKRSGERVAAWAAPEGGGIVHLNSGVVLDGRLYCAHSNYPGVPMWSSVEVFDTDPLAHVDSHSFGIDTGSATWVDRHDGLWWVGFANYDGRGGTPGRGPSWTSVVAFDSAWRRVAGYVFPAEVVSRFEGRSNSGGAWGDDGLLYATGPDAPELYVLRLPGAGSLLELVEVVPIGAAGQGLAWDRSRPGVLFTIVKRDRQVIESRRIAP